MKTVTYQFALPNYGAFSDDELMNAIFQITNRMKEATEYSMPIADRVKSMASMFLKMNFIIQEVNNRCPEALEETDMQNALNGILSNLNIDEIRN